MKSAVLHINLILHSPKIAFSHCSTCFRRRRKSPKDRTIQLNTADTLLKGTLSYTDMNGLPNDLDEKLESVTSDRKRQS